MSVANISIGQLVVSIAGRDAGHVYIVIGQMPAKMLLLADGRERKLVNPKKKNIRHVKRLAFTADGVAESLRSNTLVTDEALRQAITKHKPDFL